LRISELWKCKIISKEETKCINNSKCFHKSAFTCKGLVVLFEFVNDLKKEGFIALLFF